MSYFCILVPILPLKAIKGLYKAAFFLKSPPEDMLTDFREREREGEKTSGRNIGWLPLAPA